MSRRQPQRRPPGRGGGRSQPGGDAAQQGWLTPRRGAVLRSLLIFFAVFGVLHAWMQLDGERVYEFATRWTAQTTAWALAALGAESQAEGTIVRNSVFSIDVILECTAVFPLALYTAAVIATPSTWLAKLAGLAAGVPTILAVNLIRLVSLCYIGRWYPSAFDPAHHLVWPSLIVFLTPLFWIVWVLASAARSGSTLPERA